MVITMRWRTRKPLRRRPCTTSTSSFNAAANLAMFCAVILLTLTVADARDTYYYSEEEYYTCGSPLLNEAEMTATSQLRNREANKARLNGETIGGMEYRSRDNQIHAIGCWYSESEQILVMSIAAKPVGGVRWAFNIAKWFPPMTEWTRANSFLPNEEVKRIGKFAFQRDAKGSLIGQLMMRHFVATNAVPRIQAAEPGKQVLNWKDVRLHRTDRGRPFCDIKGFDVPDFNISHQGSYVVLASAPTLDSFVGVDVMELKPPSHRDWYLFLESFRKQFSPQEWEQLSHWKYDEEHQMWQFFRLWTLKEAVLKAEGSGITVDLSELSFDMGIDTLHPEPSIASKLIRNGKEESFWRFEESLLGENVDHVVTVAVDFSERKHTGKGGDVADPSEAMSGLSISKSVLNGDDGVRPQLLSVGEIPNFEEISYDTLTQYATPLSSPDEENARLFARKLLYPGGGRVIVEGDNLEASTPIGSDNFEETDFETVRGSNTAWTASVDDYSQQLIIDLGEIMKITGIATQGRQHSKESVLEYEILYGFDRENYIYYQDEAGGHKAFAGNKDSTEIKYNEFHPPIVARWIRINPTRWRERISMRVELYGCSYSSQLAHFNGSSVLYWDVQYEPIASKYDHFRFRFKTNEDSGILMFARGSQGDHVAVEMFRNKLYLSISLGGEEITYDSKRSLAIKFGFGGSGAAAQLSVGSLLDDNLWHEVEVARVEENVDFTVDRVSVQDTIRGTFKQMDLNRKVYFGGAPVLNTGLKSRRNFTGCMENIFINRTNLIRIAQEGYNYRQVSYDETVRYQNVHYENVIWGCPEQQIVPVTFVEPNTFIRLTGYEGVRTMNISLDFRTFEQEGMLFYHRLYDGYIKVYLHEGRIKAELKTRAESELEIDNFINRFFSNGEWHSVMVTMEKDRMTITVDQVPMITSARMDIQTGSYYYIGGIEDQSTHYRTVRGFLGCMRFVSIDGNLQHPLNWNERDILGDRNGVLLDACQMQDRCTPNPCEHGGRCIQSSRSFTCNCEGTGYSGAVCHLPSSPHSCSAWYQYHPGARKKALDIDLDGSGPLEPFRVTCLFSQDEVITQVGHSLQDGTKVDGFKDPGSFSVQVPYDANYPELDLLVNRSASCRQFIKYECFNSKLFDTPVSSATRFQPNTWWVSRWNQKMDYWGGGLPGSFKCECGVYGRCQDPEKWCNCDSGFEMWLEDKGYIIHKEYLPISKLRIGDTGDHLDGKQGKYTLGPLECSGDVLSDSAITFRKEDATLDFPTFDVGHSGDIYFEFRTTTENAVFIHSQGEADFIKVSIIGGDQIQFTYQAGITRGGVNVETAGRLNDDNWHSVRVERNRLKATVVVDGALTAEERLPEGPARALELTSTLSVGGTVDWRDGYVGCMRSLMVNGRPLDMVAKVREDKAYGVSEGCVGRCLSSPCLNNGTCLEKYNGYECDCRWTAFKGPICADEIGINMQPDNMVKYTFEGSYKSTIAENIRVGFTTTDPKGFLIGLYSPQTLEYLTLMVSNSGHLRIVFDFGFERQEFIYPEIRFHEGGYHDVRLRRENAGTTLVMQVDNYPPFVQNITIRRAADIQFNNIQHFYIGKNETMNTGFVGCISRVQFDDIFPLKLLYQEDPPKTIQGFPPGIPEDFCGIEPIKHPPEPVERRPDPDVSQRIVDHLVYDATSAILGGVLAVLFVLLVIVLLLIGRYLSRHKGEYLTQEDEGARDAIDADDAVVKSKTGHHVEKKKEWFI
ncbi:unnamed protein product [Cyprideis torosa]|uniref:L-aminoadipate-semialdehyde dehydrogenase-phosphopantetheinyl transferase n=1 Tax=Cyprideis torosa TaxID=163714 RepID=A0A7R8WBZ2_9CRUS|nr:unnamed protein product [Cyprideis torosa]CAG0892829.1 unnamed protein product [Cyprideis torosa]